MILSKSDARTVRKFRRSPYARVVRSMLSKELESQRHRFESTLADEGKRGYVQGVKAVLDVMFEQTIEVDDEQSND